MSKTSKNEVQAAYQILKKLYPDTRTELRYEDPFQLLVGVILSAQCTDERVNKTTPALFKKFPTAEAMAKAKAIEIEKLIYSCGFYKMKTKAILEASRSLVEKFKGVVPSTLEELVTLRGVGRKTASVVLNQAFDEPAIAVDTHVARVSQRLGWALAKDPKKIEFELRALFPPALWGDINGMLILHGRKLCKARKPLCEPCPVSSHCEFFRFGP